MCHQQKQKTPLLPLLNLWTPPLSELASEQTAFSEVPVDIVFCSEWLHLTFHIFGWFKLLLSAEDLSETEGGFLNQTTGNVNFHYTMYEIDLDIYICYC